MQSDGAEAGALRDVPRSGCGLMLLRLTRAVALIGGVVLLAVVVVTTASVAGRYLLALPVPGDYEITEVGCGIAVLLFFPYCELTRGNIKAAFFTDWLPAQGRLALDVLAEIAFLGVAGLIAWRFVIGGLKKLADGQVYMHLGIPLWWGYVPGAFAMLLLAVVCVYRIAESYQQIRDARPA